MRLLALLAKAKGYTALNDYQPPSEVLYEELREEPEQPGDRHSEVMRFVAETGGE